MADMANIGGMAAAGTAVGGPIGGAIGAGLGVVSSVIGGKGAKKEAQKRAEAQQKAIGAVSGARDSMNQMLTPYSNAGKEAINPLMGALGIGGQQDNYQNPLLAQIQEQTMNAMQNQAAATGRNSPADMANTVAQGLLQPAYTMQQNRIGQLQGLYNSGSSIAMNQSQMDMNAANNIGNLQIGKGAAEAQAVAAPYLAAQGGINSLAGFAGQMSGGMGGLFSGSGKQSPVNSVTPVYNPAVNSPLGVNITPSGASQNPFNMIAYGAPR